MIEKVIKDKSRAEGAHLLRKYHGKKIFVFQNNTQSLAIGGVGYDVTKSQTISDRLKKKQSTSGQQDINNNNSNMGPQNFKDENADSPYSNLKAHYMDQNSIEQQQYASSFAGKNSSLKKVMRNAMLPPKQPHQWSKHDSSLKKALQNSDN